MKRDFERGFYLCLFMLILTALGWGQHYNFKNYSIEQGLAQSQVRSLFQDSRGYLWIGTLGGGVSRFDGLNFTNFTKKDGLADNHVPAIFEDSEGNIWFGSYAGVSRYDGKKFSPLDVGNSLPDSPVRAIAEDRQGNLWFGSETGLWKYDKKTLRCFTKKDGLADDFIRSILVDREGTLWFGTGNGSIVRYDGRVFSNFSTPGGPVEDPVFSILQDRRGNLWFGAAAGVYMYDGKTLRDYTVKAGLNRNTVRTILEDREGNLWFGTDGGGISKFDGKAFINISEKNGLSSNVVWALLEDREGNIWIGTYRGGLDKYSGAAFTCFSSQDGLGDDVIRAILEDRAGNVWFATFRGGVSRFDGKTITTFTTKDGLIDNFVLTIFEDKKGNFWFGTYKGVSKYDGRGFTNLTMENGLADRVIRSICEDRRGNIWFGTNNFGISRYDGNTITNLTTADGLPDNRVNSIIEDREGKIWIATSKGICVYDGLTASAPYKGPGKSTSDKADLKGIFSGKLSRSIREECGLEQKNIYSILQDKKGSFWFAAYGEGIVKCTPAKSSKNCCSFEVFDTKAGLNNDNVVSLIFDDSGKLWIGTEKGACRFDVELYEQTGQKTFEHYGKEEGFTGIECIHNAIIKDRAGNIWFGTVKGAVKYDPGEDKPNLTEPLTHITGVNLLFTEEIDTAEPLAGAPSVEPHPGLELYYDKNYIEIGFIGLSFTAPGKVKYRYKLEGFDSIWVPGNAPYARYPNLPPGKYTFKVKACNNDELWNREPTSFSFRIMPPFWKTWWFFLLAGVLGVFLIYLLVKIRTKKLEKQRKVLENKVEKATRELKKEKDKVEQINLQLESRVKQRTADLTKANESLRDSEEKFRLVVENANDAIFIVQDEVIKFPNPKTGEMLGYSQGELANIPFTALIHPQDKDRILQKFPRTGAGGGLAGAYSFRVIDKNNNELWIDLNSVPIHWEGKPASLYFSRDITEKKKLEAQLQHAKKMEAVGTMAGGIAHDFNNLLMGILGNVSLLLIDIEENHPFYNELTNIEDCVQNGAALTRQLLGFARGGKYEVKPTDLNRVVQKSSQLFSRTRKEITVYGKYEENLRTVEVDRGQIEQVLVNLYINAWQAMPHGGDIYLQTGNVTLNGGDISLYGLKPGDYVKISVTDTGSGMDEAISQRIFEPFFTTKEMGRGTGLGLASAYGIVTNHGGSIYVDSEKDKGTTFTIYLPASDKEIVEEKKSPAAHAAGSETIMFVDDEVFVRDVGEKYLQELGYKPLLASGGQEAIEIYERNKEQIDMVILDVIMPGMGGGETFDRLKKIDPHVKVLLSSGYSIDGEAAEILERGSRGFIQKPFRLEQMSQKIRSILDKKK